MANPKFLAPGTQVAFVPTFAIGIDDPRVEFGFVTSVVGHGAFCRFWRSKSPANRTIDDLDNRSCSKLTYFKDLIIYTSTTQAWVDELVKQLTGET